MFGGGGGRTLTLPRFISVAVFLVHYYSWNFFCWNTALLPSFFVNRKRGHIYKAIGLSMMSLTYAFAHSLFFLFIICFIEVFFFSFFIFSLLLCQVSVIGFFKLQKIVHFLTWIDYFTSTYPQTLLEPFFFYITIKYLYIVLIFLLSLDPSSSWSNQENSSRDQFLDRKCWTNLA